MLNDTINLSPRLKLTDPELLDIGVILRRIQLIPFKDTLPPFQATVFEVAPGCCSPVDQHAVKECWIILKGHGELDYSDAKYQASSQDIFYFEPHHAHQIFNNNDELLVICSIYWR